jgi:hypothetical protein
MNRQGRSPVPPQQATTPHHTTSNTHLLGHCHCQHPLTTPPSSNIITHRCGQDAVPRGGLVDRSRCSTRQGSSSRTDMGACSCPGTCSVTVWRREPTRQSAAARTQPGGDSRASHCERDGSNSERSRSRSRSRSIISGKQHTPPPRLPHGTLGDTRHARTGQACAP